MNRTITSIIDEMRGLEEELEQLIEEQQQDFFYNINGAKVEFEKKIMEQQKALKASLLQWLKASRIQSILSIPFIYSMIVPLALLHITIEIYQAVCFPLYKISKVKRANYFIADRQQLPYLNIIEKINCAYCSYGNAVIAYAREIIGLTELYWCPIKHAKKILGTHQHYQDFLDFGDFKDYREKTSKLREALSNTGK
ncbi:MAG: hypothetical protein A6F70_02650 [Cycloclasticus sp. symbiont of Bathymodiolus heckerae]|nr:MAG: hypothetical protein A6F70_02650 [Cycloclasticus sp. symbiont of Bathymodiolus heckerae]